VSVGGICVTALLLFGGACDADSDRSPYPEDGPYYFSSGFPDRFVRTFDELIAASDAILVVEPTGERSEVWSPPGTSASSRFPATVQRVLKGELAEREAILLFAPGGEVEDPSGATESRRPDGGPKIREEYVDAPFFYEGVREVVFLRKFEPEAASGAQPFYAPVHPLARYRLEGARLRSILAPSIGVDDGGGIRSTVEGHDLAWLETQIRATASR
jgi:hypothetical protein